MHLFTWDQQRNLHGMSQPLLVPFIWKRHLTTAYYCQRRPPDSLARTGTTDVKKQPPWALLPIQALLSERFLFSKATRKRFSLPHAHRREGSLSVTALVWPESFCVCVHRFSFVPGCVIRGKRVKLHERVFNSLLFFYSVLWHLDDKQTEKEAVLI